MPDGHATVLRQLVVPTLRDGRVVSILGVGNKTIDYDQRDAELVSYIADLVYSIVENERAEEQIHQLNNQLERLAMTDELTGLANRRAFFVRGEEELKMARRYASPLSLLMLDIDRFKGINDNHGHQVGDQVLQLVAATMQTLIREVDKLGRIGGEEFAILLPNTGPEEASKLAERLRRGVEEKTLRRENQVICVTISVGVASFGSTTKTLDDLLRDADAALYLAKNQGRNQVALFDPFLVPQT
jgi:diguanylate cyclase (GGDEF)-like protein